MLYNKTNSWFLNSRASIQLFSAISLLYWLSYLSGINFTFSTFVQVPKLSINDLTSYYKQKIRLRCSLIHILLS